MEAQVERPPADTDEPDLKAGHTAEEGFGSHALTRIAETASSALAEQAKAQVNARYIMAMQRPRDVAAARRKLLADCTRPQFADAAIYRKPVGDGIEGPSIRMAEAAARAMGNIIAEAAAIYDDAKQRIVRVVATDLEANITYPMDVTVAKTIERSRLMPGRKVLGTRKNSRGGDVYILEAIDDEIIDKERALISKAMRTCLLRLVPGDILEEAMASCYATLEKEIAEDLPKARGKMAAGFATIGVQEAALIDYLGHSIASTPAEEIKTLRALFNAIKDKETTWAEAVEAKRGTAAPAAPSGNLGDRMAAKANGTEPAPKPAAAPEPAAKPTDRKGRAASLLDVAEHGSSDPEGA